MIVVGGTYSEYCYHPEWDQIFGSGGRGAAALSSLGVKKVSLVTCAPNEEARAIQATLAPYKVNQSSSNLMRYTSLSTLIRFQNRT